MRAIAHRRPAVVGLAPFQGGVITAKIEEAALIDLFHDCSRCAS